jgi:hypothetical protein
MAGGPSGLKDGKGNCRGFWVGSNCLNWHARREGKGRGEGGGEADSAACGGGRRTRGRRKEGGGKGADMWGPPVGAAAKKKRERGGAVGRRGVGLGRLGQIEPGALFCFFLNFIFKSIFNSNSNQTFANFSQIFYRLFIDHTSNQKPCKPNDDAQTLVVSKFIILSLIFLELKFYLAI